MTFYLENGDGKVTHIDSSTRLLTPDHVEIVIPTPHVVYTTVWAMSGGNINHVRID